MRWARRVAGIVAVAGFLMGGGLAAAGEEKVVNVMS